MQNWSDILQTEWIWTRQVANLIHESEPSTCPMAVQESKICPVAVQTWADLFSGCPGIQDLSNGCPRTQILSEQESAPNQHPLTVLFLRFPVLCQKQFSLRFISNQILFPFLLSRQTIISYFQILSPFLLNLKELWSLCLSLVWLYCNPYGYYFDPK